jgi:hypothetical protein
VFFCFNWFAVKFDVVDVTVSGKCQGRDLLMTGDKNFILNRIRIKTFFLISHSSS